MSDHAFQAEGKQNRLSNGFPRLLGSILSLSTQRLLVRKYGPLWPTAFRGLYCSSLAIQKLGFGQIFCRTLTLLCVVYTPSESIAFAHYGSPSLSYLWVRLWDQAI